MRISKETLRVRRLCLSAGFAALFAIGISYCLAADALRDVEKKIKPLDFHVIHPEILPNRWGQSVYYLGNDELPIVYVSAIIHRGYFSDPTGKEGLADLVARAWRLSGSEKYTGNEISEYFEYIGGSLEVRFDKEYGVVEMSVLTKYLDEALKYLDEMLRHPSIQKEDLDTARALKLDELKRSFEDPFSVAFRYFRRKIFDGTAYGRVETVRSLKSITITDARRFLHESLASPRISWIITGDCPKQKAVSISEGIAFREGSVPRSVFGTIRKPDSGVYIIDMPKLTQSTILYGRPTMRHNNADRIPFQVLNFIVGGGGFNSRLTREIRSNRGLAYSAGSIAREYREFGFFAAYAQTKNESVGETIKIMKEQFAKLHRDGVSTKEVQWASESIGNRFIFLFTNPYRIAFQSFSMDFDQMPEDYLDTFVRKTRSVTVTDAKRMIEKYIPTEAGLWIIVGPADGLSLGPSDRKKLHIIRSIE